MEFAARITDTGSAFPESRITNDDLAQKLTKLGIKPTILGFGREQGFGKDAFLMLKILLNVTLL